MLGESFVGKFGFMRIDMPQTYYDIWLLLLVLSLIGLATRYVMQWTPLARNEISDLRQLNLFIAALLLALAAVIHYNITVSQPQGRYLFHVLPAAACLFIAGLYQFAAIANRWRRPVEDQPETRMRTSGLAPLGILLLALTNICALFIIVLPHYSLFSWP